MGKHSFLVELLTVVYCDNQSAIQVTKIPVAHSKMKHVELHAHYLRWLVQEDFVNLVYCQTYDQVVDLYEASCGS